LVQNIFYAAPGISNSSVKHYAKAKTAGLAAVTAAAVLKHTNLLTENRFK